MRHATGAEAGKPPEYRARVIQAAEESLPRAMPRCPREPAALQELLFSRLVGGRGRPVAPVVSPEASRCGRQPPKRNLPHTLI